MGTYEEDLFPVDDCVEYITKQTGQEPESVDECEVCLFKKECPVLKKIEQNIDDMNAMYEDMAKLRVDDR